MGLNWSIWRGLMRMTVGERGRSEFLRFTVGRSRMSFHIKLAGLVIGVNRW